jgi:neutral ceramidase
MASLPTTAFLRPYAGALLSLLLCLFSVPCVSQVKVFKAGASITNITPPLGEGIVGNFGNPPPAMFVHDDLHTRSLVLDDGQTRLAFVISDNVGITHEVFDHARRLVHEETKIPMANILMSSTHTHSGISASGDFNERKPGLEKPLDAYQQFIARRMADGVRIAIHRLEPARIGWGVGRVPQHLFNRRWIMKEKVPNPFGEMDQVQFNPGVNNANKKEPAGPTDPEVSFLSVQSASGRPLAVLANYVGGVPKDHISADYFAVFADRIQELLKADRQDVPFVAIMTNGTSGDVNNINFRGPAESHPAYAKMKIVANDVANEVLRVYNTVQYKDWVPLKAAESQLRLAVRKPSEQMVARAREVEARADDVKPYHPLEKTYAKRTMEMHELWPDFIDATMQTFHIGEVGIAAIPFEVFTEIGLEIKAKSPFKPTFTIELANGCFGYLPTPEQHLLGGYETWPGTNRVEKEASRKIVKEILRLFNEVK